MFIASSVLYKTFVAEKELNELFDDYLFGMFASDHEKYMPFGFPCEETSAHAEQQQDQTTIFVDLDQRTVG